MVTSHLVTAVGQIVVVRFVAITLSIQMKLAMMATQPAEMDVAAIVQSKLVVTALSMHRTSNAMTEIR